jgi:hypothetical protein
MAAGRHRSHPSDHCPKQTSVLLAQTHEGRAAKGCILAVSMEPTRLVEKRHSLLFQHNATDYFRTLFDCLAPSPLLAAKATVTALNLSLGLPSAEAITTVAGG